MLVYISEEYLNNLRKCEANTNSAESSIGGIFAYFLYVSTHACNVITGMYVCVYGKKLYTHPSPVCFSFLFFQISRGWLIHQTSNPRSYTYIPKRCQNANKQSVFIEIVISNIYTQNMNIFAYVSSVCIRQYTKKTEGDMSST